MVQICSNWLRTTILFVVPIFIGTIVSLFVDSYGHRHETNLSLNPIKDKRSIVLSEECHVSSIETGNAHKLELMREALESGKGDVAIRYARDLMDSQSYLTRISVAQTFEWLGYRALPELSAMLEDADSRVRVVVRGAWDNVFAEINNQRIKCGVIVDALKIVQKQETIEYLLLKFSGLKTDVVLPVLGNIIHEHNGEIVAECARESYSHLTGGDIYGVQNQGGKDDELR